MHWHPYRPAYSDLREGDAVVLPSRRHWGIGIIIDACDPALLMIEFPSIGRVLNVGWTAVEPAGPHVRR
jgi:hypothetical protein